MVVIGVDTGTNTGIAIWCQEKKKITHFETTFIYKALSMFELLKDEIALVRVEDARKSYKSSKYTTEADDAKKQGVGIVKRDAAIWEETLTYLGIPFELVAPTRGSTYKAKKETPQRMHTFHKLFPNIPRLTTVGEDHIRDAVHLCYNINRNYTKSFIL